MPLSQVETTMGLVTDFEKSGVGKAAKPKELNLKNFFLSILLIELMNVDFKNKDILLLY
jgi:hypothetical protein